MDSHDIDRLLERSLSGDPPREAFRGKVLLESTAALARARRSRSQWRLATLSAAAVLIAAVSFLLGRHSTHAMASPPPAEPVAAESSETVAVSTELVAWLDAAKLFRQLGMEDRMARAVDRAHRLLPDDVAKTVSASGAAIAAGGGAGDSRKEPGERGYVTDPHESVMNANRIMALSVGD